MTRFGVRGKFVYRDMNNKSRVFTSLRYQLSAKPDFILKIGSGRYAIVEYKSASRPMTEMDWWQVMASIIAVRHTYNVREAYVVTSLGRYKVDGAHWSSSKIYRKVKRHHQIAKRIKHKNIVPKQINAKNCSKCSKRKTCEKVAI
ncbi:Dna2/Cas4 domain-containing protein [Vibrio owensii]|uniref:Dna2/Cas4 domain-containing protein n=1 Tax=Vibrio owensii TaxID=696485 RepID=UPI003CC7DFD7